MPRRAPLPTRSVKPWGTRPRPGDAARAEVLSRGRTPLAGSGRWGSHGAVHARSLRTVGALACDLYRAAGRDTATARGAAVDGSERTLTFLTIGHRGVMGVEPENTLRSYLRAERSGMDVIALDLRLSKDGALVAVHDPDVDRTTDGSGAVADLTLAELRGLDAGQGERVPVLDEVLDAVRCPLLVSLVDQPSVAALADLVRRRDLASRVEVASAHEVVLAETARLVPGVRTTLLTAPRAGDTEGIVHRALAVGAATVAVDVRLVTLATVEAAHAAGLRITGLAVDTLDLLRLARALGLDGAATAFPEIRSTGRFTA